MTCLSLALFCAPLAAHASSVWKAVVPPQVKDSQSWIDLVDSLEKNEMYYGGLAAAERMLVFFQDLPTKDKAYSTIVATIDAGFPFPIYDRFTGGDIDPQVPYDFSNSYHLYKYILSKEKGMDRWAAHYLEGIDQERFPKFWLYQALEDYRKGDMKSAEEKLGRVLKTEQDLDHLALIKRAARTLARIYFEEGEYEKSQDIYMSFLLKLNPVTPSDWLESSWNYYHLKKYDLALGMLYNLESKSVDNLVSLEKYNLRALIYRDLCSVTQMDEMVADFDRVFGKTIDGIKVGEPLASFPVLKDLDIPSNIEFNRVNQTLNSLGTEQALISRLPKDKQPTATYLYSTEMKMLAQELRSLSEKAMQNAAAQLILVSEQLRFLKYDSARAKVNPDQVFRDRAPLAEANSSSALGPADGIELKSYDIRWTQFGDYWRDERLKYRGMVPNLCGD